MGKVTKIRSIPYYAENQSKGVIHRYDILVQKVYFGSLSTNDTITLVHDPFSPCGLKFELDKEYLIFQETLGAFSQATICSLTKEATRFSQSDIQNLLALGNKLDLPPEAIKEIQSRKAQIPKLVEKSEFDSTLKRYRLSLYLNIFLILALITILIKKFYR